MANFLSRGSCTYWNIIKAGLFAILISSCEKEIKLNLPPANSKLVVEGFIERDMPPFVILTKSIPYYDTININTFTNAIVKDAIVSVEADGQVYNLSLICLSQLPTNLQEQVKGYLGGMIYGSDFCVYTDLTGSIKGVEGKKYTLRIRYNNKEYTAQSTLLTRVPIKEVFARYDTSKRYALAGFIFTDPPGYGDAYRWMYQRINKGSDGKPLDKGLTEPYFSMINDAGFDGKQIEIVFGKTGDGNSLNDRNAIFFKKGDTIIIKFIRMEYDVYEVLHLYDYQRSSQMGGPFSRPIRISSNIKGNDDVLGYWGAFTYVLDTLFIQ